MRASFFLAAGLWLCCAAAAFSAGEAPAADNPNYDIEPPTAVPHGLEAPKASQPWPVRLMIHPIQRGMFIGLPVVDTDPNRGVTTGVMPIWVLQEAGGDRIEQIWAPSVTYNKTFKTNGTIRYYYYPDPTSDLTMRASLAQVSDREAYAEYHDRTFRDTGLELQLKGQYNVDGSRRFFGIGPNTPHSQESNYKEDTVLEEGLVGYKLGHHWKAKIGNYLAGTGISDGPIDTLPDIDAINPGATTARRHQTSSVRTAMEYDSRDHDVTTTQGAYASFQFASAQKAFASEYTYQRWGVDLRKFYRPESAPRHTTALNFKYDQVVGNAPFWLMPQLGGKYIHRAYGEGRYIDNGMVTAQVEHRYTFYTVHMAGVSTEFEVAPFAGLGTVFSDPGQLASRYIRPVYGSAVRAVAKPQVVGSIDFGVGQEGLAAFMDINYSW